MGIISRGGLSKWMQIVAAVIMAFISWVVFISLPAAFWRRRPKEEGQLSVFIFTGVLLLPVVLAIFFLNLLQKVLAWEGLKKALKKAQSR